MAIDNESELNELVRAARTAIERIHKTLPGVPVTEIVEFAGSVSSHLAVTLDLSTCPESPPMALIIVRRRAGTTTILDGLTPRQLEVARLMARGWTNDQIAHALGISIGTTKDHVHAVLRRSGCRTRAGFVAALSATDPNSA